MVCKIVIVVYVFIFALLFSHGMSLNEHCDNERAPTLTGCPGGHFNCAQVCMRNGYKGGHCLDDGTDQPHCYCFNNCWQEKLQVRRSKMLLERA
ncbi:hypothetical protein DAI22_10g032250 [Oryza sativa Japonica Group]|nr:hypothetical protein DAI22_10g032250 [Oryza sativa Japonica Group]